MNSILKSGEPPLSAEDLAAVQQNAVLRLRLWKKRALWSLTAFALSCSAVVAFSAGHSLYDYWVPFGQVFLLLSMGLMLASLYTSLLWWGAWAAIRELRKNLRDN
jgi:hypothetical protein